MKITSEHVEALTLGPDNPNYNKQHVGFTQVLINIEGDPVAQFYGPMAKLLANQFKKGLQS